MELGQKYGESLYQPNILEFKNVSKDIMPWLEKVAVENNCRIEKKEWRSKYNSYVVYDYEPFCSDGFEISLTISSTSRNYIKFIQYLYEHKIKTLEYLKSCLAG
jgi:hypothetical protein